ncbi:hypothetical protein INP51_11070 [Blautia liquoris]|jgi:site-specific DNA-methyltransferase (adenine-specific)|uniref:Transcriptional activator, adenine-specific DNA methyltransferase n=1 Tax=Blautia liquoris TaxID=2779518 RepID=A0A7M2REI1_9FIRM|nr:hypothetical protein INP51_11070 [Blautia liquoris]
MKLEDICSLPISSIADKDCALFLWSTFPMIPEALKVMRSWGFTYKTVAFVWIKQNRSGNGFFSGLGHWTRSNVEICLLGIKGKPKRISKKVHQLIISPLERHSKKPDIVREKIVELMGDISRIELFARQSVKDWAVWGDEVENDISLKVSDKEI